MPSDPEQDRDEGYALEAEAHEYWSRRADPSEEWCSVCNRFGEDCRCQPDEEDEEE